MKKIYIEPVTNVYTVNIDSLLGNVSGESDGEWSKGVGGNHGGGANIDWEINDDNEDE